MKTGTFILLGLLCFSAFSQGSQELKNSIIVASVIRDDERRLKEFDRIAEELKNPKVQDAGSWLDTLRAKGYVLEDGWYLHKKQDKMTDAVVIYGSLDAKEDDDVSFCMRYSNGEFEVWVDTDEYLGRNFQMDYRVDKGSVRTLTLLHNTDNTCFWWPDNKSSVAFVSGLKNKSSLVVSYQPYREGNRTRTFDLENLERVLAVFRNYMR